jgi:hypothetical protein
VLISAALFSSCGDRTISQPSRLSENDVVLLSEAFENFDRVLLEKAPNIYAKLQPGTTLEDLDKLRVCLNGNQVEVLEKWFSWHNGAGEYILPAGFPIGIDRSVEDQRILESIPFVPEVRRNSVKILGDLAGDGFFVHVDTEKPRVFHHMLEAPENPVWFGTLIEFVDFIATGFESGILFEDEEGEFDYDGGRYEEFLSEHLKRVSTWNPDQRR